MVMVVTAIHQAMYTCLPYSKVGIQAGGLFLGAILDSMLSDGVCRALILMSLKYYRTAVYSKMPRVLKIAVVSIVPLVRYDNSDAQTQVAVHITGFKLWS